MDSSSYSISFDFYNIFNHQWEIVKNLAPFEKQINYIIKINESILIKNVKFKFIFKIKISVTYIRIKYNDGSRIFGEKK